MHVCTLHVYENDFHAAICIRLVVSQLSSKTRNHLTFKGVDFEDRYPKGFRLSFVIQRTLAGS